MELDRLATTGGFADGWQRRPVDQSPARTVPFFRHPKPKQALTASNLTQSKPRSDPDQQTTSHPLSPLLR